MKIAAQGAILIGGKSSRFGSDKAFISLENEFISVRLYNLLNSVFEDVCFIAGSSKETPLSQAIIHYDKIPNLGPLGGLLTALENSHHPFTFVLPCDLPFMNRELIHYLWDSADNADVIIPTHNNMMEPLSAFYHKNCIPKIEQALKNRKRKMTSFWVGLTIKKIDLKQIYNEAVIERIFTNINSKNDYKKALLKL